MNSLLGHLIDKRTQERFWSHVETGLPGDCWPWLLSLDRLGYGQFKIGTKKDGAVVGTHRVTAAICFDPFDEAAHYLHSCDNRRCCNPFHIDAGNHLENMADMAAKGRNRTPRPGNGFTKITPAQRLQIASMFGVTPNKSSIARLFGVSPQRVAQILREVA